MNKIYILILIILAFGCNSDKDLVGDWVVKGMTEGESRYFRLDKSNWKIENGFFSYQDWADPSGKWEHMKIISISKSELHFTILKPKYINRNSTGTHIPVGSEEIWIKLP